jgi:hypothetical protein
MSSTENEGITEISDTFAESSSIEAVKLELPPAPDLRTAIEQALKAKVDAGENLSVRAVYTRIYNEIAESNKCSYAYVAKIAKTFLKKQSEPEKKTEKIDGNKIEIETVSPIFRPPPKKKESNNLENVIGRFPSTNPELDQVNLDFETAMLEMSFENVAGIMRTVGIPAPQAKKIKRQAHLIAMFNQKMVQSGHPEQVINMGEKLLPWMLKISVVGMFIEPLGKTLMKLGDKKKDDQNGIVELKTSQRE